VFLQVMSDLEVDRARAQARVDEVRSLSQWEARARRRWASASLTDTVSPLLEDYGVRAVEVPGDFPLELADRLRERGIAIMPRPSPFLARSGGQTEHNLASIQAFG
jgi:Xaa-Pro aminopeptidase